jgi:hypothetical protein
MKELQLIFESTTPELRHNFDECRSILAENLKSYDVAVTEENLADSKKLVTELNKSAKFLEDRRKAVKKEILKPYEELEPKVKELVGMISDASGKIKSQVEVYEDERRALCKDLLEGYLDLQYRECNVQPEYQLADVSSLVKLSNLTGKNALTKTAMDGVNALVLKDKSRQDMHTARKAKVENMCLRAGVEPLTEVMYSNKLDAENDELFEYEIQSIIDAELDRQHKIEERAQAKAEAETRAKMEAEAKDEQPVIEPVQTKEPEPSQPSANDIVYNVTIMTTIVTDNPAGLADRIRDAYGLDKSDTITITPAEA